MHRPDRLFVSKIAAELGVSRGRASTLIEDPWTPHQPRAWASVRGESSVRLISLLIQPGDVGS